MKTNDKISTLEMEVAVMNYLGVRQNIVVPNVSWAFFRHECDILSLSMSGYATEIELKISKADLKKDAEKKHCHESQLLKYLYFAVPDYLVEFALEHIPDRAGLLSVERIKNTGYYQSRLNVFYDVPKIRVHIVKEAKKNNTASKWSDGQIQKLLRIGVMRILGLKRKVLKYKFEEAK